MPIGRRCAARLAARRLVRGTGAAAAAQLLLHVRRGGRRHAGSTRSAPGGSRRCCRCWSPSCADAPSRCATLPRLLRVLEAIGARSAYLALLLHNARARARLVRLATHGDFLIDQIAAHPLLLDELIDERLFEQPPDRAALAADLEQRMDGVDEGDEEQLLERLRHFQRAAMFRLAVADLLAQLPVMQVSDRLTDVAELIIERALQPDLAAAHAHAGRAHVRRGRRRAAPCACA